MRRTDALVSSSEQSVGMTKSARARFSASGSWWARMRANFSGGHAGPRERAQRAGPRASAETTAILSTCVPPPFSNSKGMSSTHHRRVGDARRGRPRARAPPPGWTSASSRRSSSGSPSTRSASAVRSTPSARSCPGNAASISATSAPSGPCSRCTDRVGVEHRHAFVGEHPRDGRLAHADRAGEAEDDHEVSSARSSASRSRGGSAAEENARRRSAAWPISMSARRSSSSPRRARLRQQRRLERRIDHVEHDGSSAKRAKVEDRAAA